MMDKKINLKFVLKGFLTFFIIWIFGFDTFSLSNLILGLVPRSILLIFSLAESVLIAPVFCFLYLLATNQGGNMKVRQGFVSNSSSSSFLLIGEEVNFDDLTMNDVENIIVLGRYLYEGQDVFDLTEELLIELHSSKYNMDEFSFYRTIAQGENYIDLTYNRIRKLPDTNCIIVSTDAEQNSSFDANSLREHYLHEEKKGVISYNDF